MIENIHRTIETAINGDVGQFIDKFGCASIGGGAAIGVARYSGSDLSEWLPGTLAMIATGVSILGGIMLALKLAAEFYYRKKDDARKERMAKLMEKEYENGDNNK